MGKIAITGGSGFIGSRIYREARKRGDEVVLLDKSRPRYELPKGIQWEQCDISNRELVQSVMEKAQPIDQLYLVAGVLGTSELNLTPSKASEANVTGLANFMDLVVSAGKDFPRTFYVTKPNVWENIYTITKEASERMIQFYMKDFGLEGVIHKWYNAYGPGQHTHPVRKAVPYFALMALNNLPLRIHGDGTQTMDLVYVDDIAKIAVESMNKSREDLTNEEVIDVGSGEQVIVNDLAKLMIDMCESKSKIVHEPMRIGETPHTKLGADTTRVREIMGPDFRFTDLEEGMLETIKYYRNINPIQAEAALDFYLQNS